jgi:GNAT superfamily N-acetyltransferase
MAADVMQQRTAVTGPGILRIDSIGSGRASKADWIRAKHAAHEGHAAFVAPLSLFEKRRLSPAHNPFFELGEAEFFVAYRNGRPVGRISAQAHRAGQAGVSPETGHFGFFDVTEDEAAAHALLDAAAQWLSARGATDMRGPFSLSINEECGCQIDAFDVPSTYLMPQARPWSAGLLESWGMEKRIDMHAWRVGWDGVTERMAASEAMLRDYAAIKARPIRMDRFEQDVALLADIFNDAWSGNWGFVPFSPRAVKLLAAELKLIYRSTYGYFVEMDGVPVGVFIGLPNINEIIKPFGGRLTPLNAVRLGWSLFNEKVTTSRIPIAGIRKSHQSGLMGTLLAAAMMQAVLKEARRRPKAWYEFSWVLETNKPAISALKLMGAERTSTYRIYGKALG